ncbi:MAG: hypothetical protein XXXJIFNMEKO3_01462 [Candidatus Erwinia impunctatus]|nr:hypothetical protein XXXJIFNMEKO_01462 [Culicoides impunctatus]
MPARDAIREAYSSTIHIEIKPSEPVHRDPYSIGMEIDLLSDSVTKLSAETASSPALQDTEFAGIVYHLWLQQLRQLPENSTLCTVLGIYKPVLEMLTSELVTASIRQDIPTALAAAVSRFAAGELPAQHLADRQVSAVLGIIGDFVAWLGFLQRPESERPESKVNHGMTIFARPQSAVDAPEKGKRLSRLSATPKNHGAFYL